MHRGAIDLVITTTTATYCVHDDDNEEKQAAAAAAHTRRVGLVVTISEKRKEITAVSIFHACLQVEGEYSTV